MDQAGNVKIVVTRIERDGNLVQREVETSGRSDAGRWERLISNAALDVPPPYEPVPGAPVYQISTGGKSVMLAQRDLTGPMEELVAAVLTEGAPLRQ